LIMTVRIISIMVFILGIVFGIGMPVLLYADDLESAGEVNISALVPAAEEEEEEAAPTGGGAVSLPDTVPPQISDIIVDNITSDSAVISWKTSEPSIPQINYGKTREYEKTIIGKDFLTNHRIILEELLADTVYHFEIVVADRSGNRTSSGDYTFKTLVGPDILAPANISNFEAVAGDGQISLKWRNPIESDFQAVRIMRSEDFYPQDPEQGKLVYDSRETSFIDTGLINGKRYYYTAFSYDFSGNFSSGAIVSAVPWPPEIAPPVIPLPPEVLPPIVPSLPEVEKITIEDFDFIQAGKKILIVDGKLEIKKEESLEILINYDKVPEVLKTITVTLKKGEKFFSFLLRVNKEKTAYLATLMPPEEPGVYPITITVLDYKNQTLKKIVNQLIVFGREIPVVSVPWYKNWQLYIYILILLKILILIGVIYFYKKFKAQNDSIN